MNTSFSCAGRSTWLQSCPLRPTTSRSLPASLMHKQSVSGVKSIKSFAMAQPSFLTAPRRQSPTCELEPRPRKRSHREQSGPAAAVPDENRTRGAVPKRRQGSSEGALHRDSGGGPLPSERHRRASSAFWAGHSQASPERNLGGPSGPRDTDRLRHRSRAPCCASSGYTRRHPTIPSRNLVVFRGFWRGPSSPGFRSSTVSFPDLIHCVSATFALLRLTPIR